MMINSRSLIIIALTTGYFFASCSQLPVSPPTGKPVIATLPAPASNTSIEVIPTNEPTIPAGNGRIFKMGLLVPFSGPLAFLGEGYQMGVELALKEENFILENHPLELVLEDTQGTPEGTIQAAEKLIINSKVDILIGPGTSPEALAAIPVATKNEIPLIDASSTDPDLLSKMGENGSQWYYRINADEGLLAKFFSSYIAKDHKSIAIISEDDSFNRKITSEYISQFEKENINITLQEFFPATETEYRPVLFRTRQSRPDALFLVMSEASCALLMQQYKTSFTTIPVFSRGACATGLFNQIVDDPTIGENITEAVIFSELQDKDLATKFFQEYGQTLTGHRMAGYYTTKYVIIPALKDLVQSGITINPENIRKAIDNVRVQTPIGLLYFNNFNQASLDAALLTNKNGQPAFLGSLPLK